MNKYTSISACQVFEILEEKKDGLDWNDLGFITTVLRDNELDDDLHNYYQAVLKFLDAHRD